MSLRVPLKHSDELQAAGWTRRFTAIGRRLNEAVELYRQLGFEILLDAVELDDEHTDGGEICRQCLVAFQACTIYTRPCETITSDRE
jgi:hypothetical protein